jgi:hypothetical protein
MLTMRVTLDISIHGMAYLKQTDARYYYHDD